MQHSRVYSQSCSTEETIQAGWRDFAGWRLRIIQIVSLLLCCVCCRLPVLGRGLGFMGVFGVVVHASSIRINPPAPVDVCRSRRRAIRRELKRDKIAKLLVDDFCDKRAYWTQSFWADLWVYYKDSHPVVGVFFAHRLHPYSRDERRVVYIMGRTLPPFPPAKQSTTHFSFIVFCMPVW